MRKSHSLIGSIIIPLFISSCNTNDNQISACQCEAANTIEKTTIVSPSSPTGSLSNYGEDGSFTADAACHAEMLIEFSWQDSARASTPEVPPIIPSFDTPLGYFPSSSLHTSESVEVHPDGSSTTHYKFFYYVNEAEDKTHPEGTSYRAEWRYDAASTAPAGNVRVSASIKSQVYDEEEYKRTNLSECAN